VDKDQVLEEVQDLRERISRAIERVTSGQAPMRIPAEISDVDLVLADCLPALAELESLRAVRKRVEATLDGWTRRGTTLTYEKNACAEQLRAALGDSHE
jgi:hypothetical protein